MARSLNITLGNPDDEGERDTAVNIDSDEPARPLVY
jgi:hypothetical protein